MRPFVNAKLTVCSGVLPGTSGSLRCPICRQIVALAVSIRGIACVTYFVYASA